MKLNKERTLANVNLTGEKTAEEIEEMIEKLAALREQMSPPVPASKELATHLHMVDTPNISAARLKTGGVRLYARSAALGWIGLTITQENAPMLTKWLVANLDWITNLVEPSGGHGDASIH
jgi:hypothetical protein